MASPGTATASVAVEELTVRAYTVPTETPESDGTLEWDETTLILVEARAGETVGIGYTYGDLAVRTLIDSKLGGVVLGADALSPGSAWISMRAAVRNAGQQGVGAMA